MTEKKTPLSGWKTVIFMALLAVYMGLRAAGLIELGEQVHEAVLAFLAGSAGISLRLGVAKAEAAARG